MTEKNTAQGAKPAAKAGLKARVSGRLNEIINRIKAFLNQIYLGEDTYNYVGKKLVNAVKVFIVSTQKFMRDNCTTRASSIAYTTIISLIPTLTVALTFYSVVSGVGNKKEQLFRNITLFMLQHNIRLNIDPVLDSISGLIDNAGKIGGIGAVIMIFTATAVLRTLEQSLNDIYEVKRQRSIALRMVYYWAALTLGPIMLIAGTTVATEISRTFTLPSYRSVTQADNNLWIVGSRASILQTPMTSLHPRQLNFEKIDFDNQRIYQYETSHRTFYEDEFRIELLDLKKSKFTDIQFVGKNGWIAGKDGILLTTRNGGESWMIEKWGSFNFLDIHMLNAQKGYMVTDNGCLLWTENGGKGWEVKEWPEYSSSLNSITFDRDRGIITGDRGVIITTANGGTTWEFREIEEAKRKGRPVNLNGAFFINNTIWLAGNDGVILVSNDAGKTWTAKKFQENNYRSVFFSNPNTGFVAGEEGVIISTTDGGANWRRINLTGNKINRIASIGGRIWLIGADGLIAHSRDNGRNWTGLKGRSFIIILLNFFGPFIFIWLLFLLTYMILPNIKVPFKPAAIGAAFTGTVWVSFILLFIVYVKYFAGGSVAVYGALAAIPIFLLMVYASALIMLYGAEVSYTLMHPHTYLKLKRTSKDLSEMHVAHGLAILHFIYNKFEAGKGETTLSELLKLTSQKADEVSHFIRLFKKEKLISENASENYLPANASANIKLADVIELVHNVGLTLPPSMQAASPVRKYLQKLLKELDDSRKKTVGGATLHDLIKGG